MKVWLMDAFTLQRFGGNPAGVVPDARGLSEFDMQRIANELHASETAFVLPPRDGEADLRLRYFTPTNEVDLCGHATIGAICGLLMHGYFGDQSEGVCRAETNVGVLPISYRRDGDSVWAEMRQASPQFRTVVVDDAYVADLLGIERAHIDKSLPMQLCYTGLWDMFVPVASTDVMRAMSPKLANLASWNKSLGIVSTHVYSRDALENVNDFHTRDFSPAVGIPEDPATGTATGALAALLHNHGLVSPGKVYRFEQGYEIHRPSVISARIAVRENEVGQDETRQNLGSSEDVAVFVGGNAVCSLSGVIHL